MTLCWRTWIVAAVLVAACGVINAADSVGANLLTNGGMEQWRTDSLPAAGPSVPAIPDGIPVGWGVSQEAYERGDDPGFVVKGEVSRDTAIKAAGEASLHISNAQNSDISEVSQGAFAVQPNAVYRVRCQVRGEKIVLNARDGCGVIVWGNTGTGAPGDMKIGYQYLARSPVPNTGSFDWQAFEFFVETGPQASWMRVALQLRRAVGEAWFDEVEVACVAQVHPVESY